MDPNANIREQLELAREVQDVCESQDAVDANKMPDLMDVARLAELVLALDEWRRNGGFDPYRSPEEG